MPWPDIPYKRASINSFGFGGSNAHVILDNANDFIGDTTSTHVTSYMTDDSDFFAGEVSTRPIVLVFSANDEQSLKGYWRALKKHLINPNVDIQIRDLAYTFSERRTHHFHRGYVIAESLALDDDGLVLGKKRADAPKIALVFTGQGAQWSTMGKSFIDTLPSARPLLILLDKVLQSLPAPPSWSLLVELTEPRESEHLRQPEFSQPLVTALQLVILETLTTWGIRPKSVVGHSSGEIAAACAAGYLTPEEAIKIAYFRGQAASNCQDNSKDPVGMLAVGLGPEAVQRYIFESKDPVRIGCYNSPESVTLSGRVSELETIKNRLQQDHHFARMLLVDLAYHSPFMTEIAEQYEDLLLKNCKSPLLSSEAVTMFSSVTGQRLNQKCDATYWKDNMVSPVRFDQAVQVMVSEREAADFLIEIGPSGALAGPIGQIKAALTGQGSNFEYIAASKRGPDAVKALFDVSGRIFIAGGSVNMMEVNKDRDHAGSPAVIVDLPNYRWNHSMKYWRESQASKDWRFKQFPQHDLLGSKVLGTSWQAPAFSKILRVEDVPWMADHKVSHIQILVPLIIPAY